MVDVASQPATDLTAWAQLENVGRQFNDEIVAAQSVSERMRSAFHRPENPEVGLTIVGPLFAPCHPLAERE
jgi:uncharacterized protein YhjY with autotransporter beta-barrel domain